MKKKALTKKPTMRYAIIHDAEDIGRELFQKYKLDFIVTICTDCPSYEGIYLYFLSGETASTISSLLGWKQPLKCATYFCIKTKGDIPDIINKIEKKAEVKEIKIKSVDLQ